MGESELLAAVRALEGLLPRVQELVLVQEAAEFEPLAASGALVRPPPRRMLPPVVLHDGAMAEDQAAFGAFVGLEGGVRPLVDAEGHRTPEALVALLAAERTLQGVRLHVGVDGHLVLELPAAERAAVRLLQGPRARVAPQLDQAAERLPAVLTLRPPAFPAVDPLLQTDGHALLLVLAAVLDQAAAVLKGEAALLAGEGGQLVLVRVEVPMQVVRLAAGKQLAALPAYEPALPLLHRRLCFHHPALFLFQFLVCVLYHFLPVLGW